MKKLYKKGSKEQISANNNIEVYMSYKIKEYPKEERPRERLKKVGRENLTDKELVAIILKTGTKEKNVEEVSLELLKKYCLIKFKELTINEITSIKGIGEVKAIELLAAIELGKRIYLRDSKKLKKIECAKKIWEDARYLMNDLKQEHFYCYYFNNKQELIKRKLIFIGTINSSITHPREIFKEAYLLSASTIVCLHNHPSNDTTPSQADIKFTNELVKIGKIQKIPVIDHIIVGEDNYYSFYEHQDILNL